MKAAQLIGPETVELVDLVPTIVDLLEIDTTQLGQFQGSSLLPLITSGSFQARFTTSRMPAFMPWPRKGGVWCAASPAMKTLPTRQRSAVAA